MIRFPLSADQIPDLLPYSAVRIVIPSATDVPIAEGRTPWARRALRKRRLFLLGRLGARDLAGALLGLLAGWSATALWVLAS